MKVQFNRAVRLLRKVYAAGSVHSIDDVKVLKHPHFVKFQKAGALEAFVEKPAPKVLPKATFGPGSLAEVNPSAKDGRLPGLGGNLKAEHDKKEAAKKEVKPETTVGDDDESADELDADSEVDGDEGDEDFDSEFSDAADEADEEASDDESADDAEDEEAADEEEAAPKKKKKKAKKKSRR